MKELKEKIMTTKFKMVSTMEDFINEFKRIWLHAGYDKRRYSVG